MQDQPRYEVFEANQFFGDSLGSRVAPEGTVARGNLDATALWDDSSKDAGGAEFQLTMAMINAGQDRYNIFCSPCHGKTGYGDGMVVRRGFQTPPSLHIARLQQAPDRYFYDVITNGFGTMPDYAYQLSRNERWEVIAYLRALQLSQHPNLRTAR